MKIQEKKTVVIVVEKILDFNKQVKGLPSDLARVANMFDRKGLTIRILKC